MALNDLFVLVQRDRWKAGRSPITSRKRGVSLEHGPAFQLRTASGGKSAPSQSSVRGLTAVSSRSPARNRAAAHYWALVGAAVSGCLSLPRLIPQPASRTAVRTEATGANRPTADHAGARLPRATWWTLSRPVELVFSQLGGGTGVEPVTASSLDWCSTY